MATSSCCQLWSLPMSLEDQKRHRREYVSARRAAARIAGIKLPGDDWAKKNPDRHRENVAKWRARNPQKSSQIYRSNQATRRSTPWGRINNCMWPLLHRGLRANTPRMGKYNTALGYSWGDLRAHIEMQFSDVMTWANWGEVWEIDHITPLSSFHFQSLSDPLFKACWAMTNLRPLLREQNQKKRAMPEKGGGLPRLFH